MRLKQHAIYGGFASIALSPVLGLTSIAFWAGSVLIDADHYLEYIYHNRLTNFSVRKMWDYHDILGDWLARPDFLNLSIFHTVEFLSLFYLAALWLDSSVLKAFFYGMLFHLILDTIQFWSFGFINKRAYSVVEFLIRREIIKRKGLHPLTPCREALDIVLGDTPPNRS